MTKYILLIISLFMFQFLSAQKIGDSRIIVKLNDSAEVYNKVKKAFIKCDLIIKDDGNRDTISTYPKDLVNISGNAMVTASISGGIVIIQGVYGIKKSNYWGDKKTPGAYHQVIYFKGSKSWLLLMKVATAIGSDISFAQ